MVINESGKKEKLRKKENSSDATSDECHGKAPSTNKEGGGEEFSTPVAEEKLPRAV